MPRKFKQKNDSVNRRIIHLSWQKDPLQTTMTLPIEASPTHRYENMVVAAVMDPVQAVIRAKILRLRYQRMTHG